MSSSKLFKTATQAPSTTAPVTDGVDEKMSSSFVAADGECPEELDDSQLDAINGGLANTRPKSQPDDPNGIIAILIGL